ncbi:hypothetical protein BC829DRAFT_394187 [Chytridium lagenaria]|nr:hypothetical protein BC829DRAFT_394187 [Chytridium lagenaria]
MRNKTMALEDCVDDDEQRYRHLKYRENESIMRAQKHEILELLAVDDCNGESIYYLSPDSKLKATSFRTCISSEDISIIECENSTAFGWIYEYLPSTTVSSKERLFRLKAGNGQCLHQVQRNRFQMRTCTYEGEQIFRRALIDDPTKGFQNIKFFQCLSSAAPDDIGRIGLGGGSCNRLETTFLSGGKLVNSRLNERLCLSWDLLYKPCDNSSDQEGWELETFIPHPQRVAANPELKPAANQESQQFRRARGFGQSNSDQDIYKAWAMQSVESYHCYGSVDPNELRTLSQRILVHRDCAIESRSYTCTSTKSRYFRLKSGTNQCLQQQSVTQYQLQPCSDVDIQKFRLDVTRSFHPHLQNAVSDDFGRMGVPVYLEGELIVCLSSTLVFENCPQTVNATFSWVGTL